MKVTLESTDEFITHQGVKCRVWRGRSKGGVECFAFIPLIAAKADQDRKEFDHELIAQDHVPFGTHFDMRNVL